MKKYIENIEFKKIYCVIIMIMFVMFGIFFTVFCFNGQTRFLLYSLIIFWILCLLFYLTDLRHYLIQFCFFITMWLFLFSRPMIDYIFNKSFSTYNETTYQFAFFVLILSMIGLLVGTIIGKYIRISNKMNKQDNEQEMIYKVHIKYIRISSLCIFFISYPLYFARIIERYFYRRNTTYYDYYATFHSQFPYIVYLISVFTFFSMCVYLATKPKKKYTFMVLVLYIIANSVYLLIGTRNPFILSLIFTFIYYCMRHFDDKKEVWIGKKEKILMIVISPLLMLSMGAMNYVRDNVKIATDGLWSLFIDFIYKQGTSFGVLANGYIYESYLPERSFRNYTFGPIIDYIYRGNVGRILFQTQPFPENNSIELAMESNSYAHNLSYIVLEEDYLNGHGIGSCFIMELFTDYRFIGVFVFSIALGMVCVWMMKSAYMKNIFLFSISLVVLENLLFTPRASFMSSFMPLFTIQFWIVIGIIFGGARMLGKYNKNDYLLDDEREKNNA